MKHSHFIKNDEPISFSQIPITLLVKSSLPPFLNLVEQSHFSMEEHSHFSIWWNTVNSQFGGTQSFLNLKQCCYFSIWQNTVISRFLWNTVISQFGGTQSFLDFCGTQSFLDFCGTQSFLDFFEHSHFSICWCTVISRF